MRAKDGLESMVGAVEKVMNDVSDGMTKEWRAREKEDKENEEKVKRMENRREKERKIERKEEGRWRRG